MCGPVRLRATSSHLPLQQNRLLPLIHLRRCFLRRRRKIRHWRSRCQRMKSRQRLRRRSQILLMD